MFLLAFPFPFFLFLRVGASYSTRSYRQGYKRKPPDKEQRTEYRLENRRETKKPKLVQARGLKPTPPTVRPTTKPARLEYYLGPGHTTGWGPGMPTLKKKKKWPLAPVEGGQGHL